MTGLLDIALPLLVIFVMTVVGLDLRPADFARARRRPVAISVLLVGQWLAAFVVAVVAGRWSWLPAPAAAGLLLLAAAPAAPLGNYYAQLSRGAVAMAVTATALSTVLAVFLTPFVAARGFHLVGASRIEVPLPPAVIALQLVVGLLLPVAVGMVIRFLAPSRVAAWRPGLQAGSVVAIAVLLAAVLAEQWPLITDRPGGFAVAALVFTAPLLAVGVLLTRLALPDGAERRALVWGFPVRSVAVAVLLATGIDGGRQVIAAVAVVFVIQTVVAVPLALWLAAAVRPSPDGRSSGAGARGAAA